ncbi:hypothetical protein AS19_00660 [Alcanivorax sp. NBRC 101098]|nr:hypothetical protein AS19_00660 [Alcanivorax sp. NBRC 101098]
MLLVDDQNAQFIGRAPYEAHDPSPVSGVEASNMGFTLAAGRVADVDIDQCLNSSVLSKVHSRENRPPTDGEG